MCERVIALLKELSQKYSRTVKVIHCNNSRENVTLAATCKRKELGIDFEFTALELLNTIVWLRELLQLVLDE